MQPRHRLGIAIQSAKTIQQGAMGVGVEQAAVILLAMHFQQQAAQILQQAHAHRFVIDEGAALAVAGKVRRSTISLAVLPCAWSRSIAQAAWGFAGSNTAVAEPWPAPARTLARPRLADRQPQRIQQDGFARPGFAGQHVQAGANSSAACSIRTMSRMVSAASTACPRI